MWSHLLKVYGRHLNGDATWEALFTELVALLGVFDAALEAPSVRVSNEKDLNDNLKEMIIQYSGLIINMMMSFGAFLASALEARTARVDGGRNCGETSDAAGATLGGRVTNVAFSIVSRLFRFVNTEMLYYPRLGERFVALTCVLVELYPARLLGLPAQQKQNFIDCLCYAAQHHDKDVLEGALDAIASLACFLQSGSEQLQRFTHVIFNWFLFGKVFDDRIIKLHATALRSLANSHPKECMHCISQTVNAQPDHLQSRLHEATSAMLAATSDADEFASHAELFARTVRAFL
jgi:hypothetical protein